MIRSRIFRRSPPALEPYSNHYIKKFSLFQVEFDDFNNLYYNYLIFGEFVHLNIAFLCKVQNMLYRAIFYS